MKILAQTIDPLLVGTIANPMPTAYQSLTGPNGGLILFLTNILRLVFVVAGIYAFINFILAGFQFMSAGGDTKAISAAMSRIYNSLIGLVLVVASFALAALFSQIIFGKADFILNPKIWGPGQ
jgi:hypothetical protein